MNKLLRCILIDDEINNINLLEKMLHKHCPEVMVIAKETDAENGVILINQLSPDLVFLDIEMPTLNGFEVLKKLEPIRFEIIFVTAYANYAIEAFDYHAIAYVTKPIDIEKLKNAVKSVQRRVNEKSTNNHIFSLLEEKIHGNEEIKIPLSTLNGLVFIKEQDIVYCEGNGNYTNFFTVQDKKIMVSRIIGDYEKLLSENSFIRIHEKFIINLRYVQEYIKGRGGEIIMDNKVSLPVSANRKDAFLSRFEKWFRK